MQNGNEIRIGIDPAFRRSGFGLCVIDEEREVRFIRVASFLHFLRWLGTDAPPENVRVVIENSNLQDTTFTTRRMSYNEYGARSRDAGKNMAISQCTADACVHKWGEAAVVQLSPRQKGKKWSVAYARAVAKGMGLVLPGKMSQDDVDAFALALIG